MKKPLDIDRYIADFPEEVRERLEEIRSLILVMASGAEERISYGMPAFYFKNAYLIYFAGYKSHIGIYPAPTANDDFKKDFEPYKTGKGSVQFPLDKTLPTALIKKIIRYRIKQVVEKQSKKKLKAPVKKTVK